MTTPTVSVVIPTYDRADVLGRAMDSVLGQTFEDLELIVVDDGSTDDTPAVATGYDDDRVRYLAHETNRGANVARNTGIEAAAGEYVAFLDSDDEWREEKLERQLARMDADDAVAVYCDFETRLSGASAPLRSATAALLARADEEPAREGQEELASGIVAGRVHPGAGSTLVVRTAVARAVGGFDETLDRFQDPEFVLRIVEEGPVGYVDAPLVVRHDTPNPSAETVAAADRQYLRKHADLVERAEADGYDVRGRHDLVVAKEFLAEGALRRGLVRLGGAGTGPRHLPGVLWAAGTGLRRRTDARGVAVATGLALVAAGLLSRRG
jgi:glycosyltransferase involved in cell wall biosynthesis